MSKQKLKQVVAEVKTYSSLPKAKFIDIGANLTTPCFDGDYYGRTKHRGDVVDMLVRSVNSGVHRVMITGCDLKSSKKGLELVDKYPGFLTTTIGFHPTHTNELAKLERQGKLDDAVNEMRSIAKQGITDGTIVAIGECGYDFHVDRLKFSDEATQRRYFPLHLDLALETALPLFLHNRESGDAMIEALTQYGLRVAEARAKGDTRPLGHCVIHSFDGGVDLMTQLLAIEHLTVYIGLNGCSLREEAGLEVARVVPLDRLMLETDAPYCAIKRTHPGHQHVKTVWATKKPDKFKPQTEAIFSDILNPTSPSHEDASTDAAVLANAEPATTATAGSVSALISGEEELLLSSLHALDRDAAAAASSTATDADAASSSTPIESRPRDARPLPTLVDGRSEPCMVVQVAEVVAAVRGVAVEEVAAAAYNNTMKCFFRSK